MRRGVTILLAALLMASSLAVRANAPAYGLVARVAAPAYWGMPDRIGGKLPQHLSETGIFKDLVGLQLNDAFIPYDLVVPFWSDGANKSRRVSVPAGQTIKFSPTGEWVFPRGTVFVKTFTFATNANTPDVVRRLETRLLVCDANGGVYGVTYKWRPDNQDADLLATNLTETLVTTTATGTRSQPWYYPSRHDCLDCHTANAGYVLGVKTRQMNRDLTYPSGVTDNQLRTWNHLGLFDTTLDENSLASYPTLASMDDVSRSLTDRARSYLDANCAHCHRPEGTVAYFDARYDTPLERQGLVDGRVLIDERIDHSRVIAPNDIWRSIMYMRANTTEAFKMPPLARNTIDEHGMALLRQWIESLPGPPVLPPVEISPVGGHYVQPVAVTLQSEPGAVIYYTLDGTVPTTSDLLYQQPVPLSGPTILRARAFKPGSTRSITAQQIFLVGK